MQFGNCLIFCVESEREALSLKGLGKANVVTAVHRTQDEADRIYILGLTNEKQGDFVVHTTGMTTVHLP